MAHTMATMLSSGKGRRPTLQDFLMRWAPRRRQTGQEQLRIFEALAARLKKETP